MDLSRLPVIDNHMHIMTVNNTRRDMNFTISDYPIDEKHVHSMIAYKMFISRISKFFGMEGASAEEVIKERNRRYDEDPKGYIDAFMKDANIKALICDLDSPITAYWKGNYRTDKDAETFIELMEPEIKIGRIIRIEIVANLLLKEKLSFEDFLAKWRANMLAQAEKFDIIAVKSVIAYFTGLAVTCPDDAQAKKAYDSFMSDRNDRASEKTWRDYMLHKGLEFCLEFGYPLQIHTGYGDVPYADLRVVNPILLTDLFNEELSRKVTTVLLHGGYPYCREIGILASQFPQVYLDFSEFTPHAGYALETALPMIFETAPYTKVLYGTDGGGGPENVWLGVMYTKDVLGRFLDRLLEKDYITEADAIDLANAVLWRNATEVYPKLYKDGIPF
ncbi:MAG: amidohydrolase family protein [Christensenellaceae bacterium]|nr:amidohydrolase family protein [Christensenellaceae bacterium]